MCRDESSSPEKSLTGIEFREDNPDQLKTLEPLAYIYIYIYIYIISLTLPRALRIREMKDSAHFFTMFLRTRPMG